MKTVVICEFAQIVTAVIFVSALDKSWDWTAKQRKLEHMYTTLIIVDFVSLKVHFLLLILPFSFHNFFVHKACKFMTISDWMSFLTNSSSGSVFFKKSEKTK